VGVLGVLALVAALALAGCPLPQPLPESMAVDGGTVTPPRIVADSASPKDTVVPVGTTAATAPAGNNPNCPPPDGTDFAISAQIEDDNTDETVDARWFVDYQTTPGDSYPAMISSIPAPTPASSAREVPPYHFKFEKYAGTTHVVELVVSNGFYPLDEEPADIPLPHRSPRPGYETQVYRWVFQTAAQGWRCQ
jgi:hypothetical protein